MLIIYLLLGLIASILEVGKFENIDKIPLTTRFLVYVIYIVSWPLQLYVEYIRPKLGKLVPPKNNDDFYY
jgi:hypothetical protein